MWWNDKHNGTEDVAGPVGLPSGAVQVGVVVPAPGTAPEKCAESFAEAFVDWRARAKQAEARVELLRAALEPLLAHVQADLDLMLDDLDEEDVCAVHACIAQAEKALRVLEAK